MKVEDNRTDSGVELTKLIPKKGFGLDNQHWILRWEEIIILGSADAVTLPLETTSHLDKTSTVELPAVSAQMMLHRHCDLDCDEVASNQ